MTKRFILLTQVRQDGDGEVAIDLDDISSVAAEAAGTTLVHLGPNERYRVSEKVGEVMAAIEEEKVRCDKMEQANRDASYLVS